MNKKAQFYLILTAFIVSAFLIISSSLLSFKETTQRNIEIPFSDLPKVAASVETSVRNNLELAFEEVGRTGDITYLTSGVSNLTSGQYLIQEGELNYFLDNFDLGIYNVSDLTILGPSSFEIGLPEAKILGIKDLGGGRYSVKAKPGLGNLLVELLDTTGPLFDYITNPYVYIVDDNPENDNHEVGMERVIYLTYDYTSSMRATKDGDTYLLGESARVYADESNKIIVRLSNMKQDHILTLASLPPHVTYLGTDYIKGQVIAIEEAGEVLGLIMVGEVDTQNKYLDYILLNLQKKISGEEKRKVSFDPYPEEGLKDDRIYCNIYPEIAESGDKVIISSIIHDNLFIEISDKDLACNNIKDTIFDEYKNNFTDIEPFGFFITEPFIEKEYEIEISVPSRGSGIKLIEMGYHKDVEINIIDGGTTFAIYGNTVDLNDLQTAPDTIELKEGESADFLGSYIKVISIEGAASPYTVKLILKNPYLIVYDRDPINYTVLPGLEESYTANIDTINEGLFFGNPAGGNDSFGNEKYVDFDNDSRYDYNETIISSADNIYDAGDTVIKGIAPEDLTPLESFDVDEMYADVGDVPLTYDPKDVIFEDTNLNGNYDVGEPVIPTFYAGDFFVLENFLCFIESYDTDVVADDFFRVVPVYTKGEQETFTPDSYRIFKGFDVSGDFDPEAIKLVEFKYENKGWKFCDVDDSKYIYFNSYSVIQDSNASIAVDNGIVYSFFDGDTSKIDEKDFYHYKNYDGTVATEYNLSGYTVWAVIEFATPPPTSHPDQFDLNIWEYENPGVTFTIADIREGDVFFVAGQGYKVLGIYIDTGNSDNNSIFFVPVHSYQFNVINSLYKEKTISGTKIQRYTSFLDVYEFYPEREGTYSFSIKYYYWTDLDNENDIDENEISMVTEKYTFIVI